MTSPRPVPEHGTVARYQRHRLEGTETCEECRAAWREYVAAWRLSNTERGQRLALARARDAAVRDLIAAHPTEFRQRFAAAKRKEGL